MSNLNQFFSNNWTTKRWNQRIFLFIVSVSLKCWKHIIFSKLIFNIKHVWLDSSNCQSFVMDKLKIFTFTDIHTNSNNIIIFFKPCNSDWGIKTSRIGKNNFLFWHNIFSFLIFSCGCYLYQPYEIYYIAYLFTCQQFFVIFLYLFRFYLFLFIISTQKVRNP